MSIPKSVKKWCTRETGYEGEDNWFTTRTKARDFAKSKLILKAKRVVHIGRMSESRYANRGLYKHGDLFVNVERWELVNGFPKKVGVR